MYEIHRRSSLPTSLSFIGFKVGDMRYDCRHLVKTNYTKFTRIVEKERLTAKEMSDIRRNIQGMGEKAGLDICYTSFKSKKVTQVSKEGGRAVVEIHNNMAGAVFSKGEQSLPPGVSTKPVFKIHAMC